MQTIKKKINIQIYLVINIHVKVTATGLEPTTT